MESISSEPRTTADPIERISARTVTLPLPNELRLGPMVIRERHYAVVRVTTRSGLTGHAYAQSRGAPVTAIIDDLLSPPLIGADASAIEDRWRDMFRSTMAVGRVGLVMRGISLIDIALWDIRAQRAGLPLYRLLGGDRGEVPVMMVAGYPDTIAGLEEIVVAAGAAARAGHRAIKVSRALDPSITRRLLERLEEELPEEAGVVVDAGWVWTEAAEAIAELRGSPTARLLWLEDPFPPEDIAAYRELKAAGIAPIGVGDELTDPAVSRALLDAGVDVLRVDLCTIGGFTPAAGVVRLAADRGVPVSFHVYPEISAHAAAAWPIARTIETFDRSGNPYDPSHELIEGGPRFADGFAYLPDTPGIGFTIDPASG